MRDAGAKDRYGTSLFERLHRRSYPTLMLTEQYRMHPSIAAHPSERYYGGLLTNSLELTRRQACPFYNDSSGKLGPFQMHRVTGMEREAGSSISNSVEAKYVLDLFKYASTKYADTVGTARVGIITPYAGMRDELTRLFTSERLLSSDGKGNNVSIATIDGFQGRERDIVIFACVRSKPRSSGGSIGFLKDKERINVALTRAKIALWIVGNFDYLSQCDEEWKSLITHADKTQALVDAMAF
jgi:senataxin